ncbi:MAG TPA: hypothetical protein VFU26_13865 [Gaiellaceae bacterium]|nr:hypothetical protein [Gaiellaceae bacterium]
MQALALIVAALGGGIVATLLNEWLRGQRDFTEAKFLVLAELATMGSLAQDVQAGRLTREWVAAAGFHTAAWETYQVRLARALSRDLAAWGRIGGAYVSVGLFRANPGQADMDGMIRTLADAHAALSGLKLRRLLGT